MELQQKKYPKRTKMKSEDVNIIWCMKCNIYVYIQEHFLLKIKDTKQQENIFFLKKYTYKETI